MLPIIECCIRDIKSYQSPFPVLRIFFKLFGNMTESMMHAGSNNTPSMGKKCWNKLLLKMDQLFACSCYTARNKMSCED